MTQAQSDDQQVTKTEHPGSHFKLPAWPTSQPGPKITEPPIGTKRVNRRTEQVVEVGYDQEQGKSTKRGENIDA